MPTLPYVGHTHMKGTDWHSKLDHIELAHGAHAAGFRVVHLTPHFRDPNRPHDRPRVPSVWSSGIREAISARFAQVGVTLCVGAEIDIVPKPNDNQVVEARLDGPLPPQVWPVIMAMHFTRELWPWIDADGVRCPQQTADWVTAAYLDIIATHPTVHVIGHPYRYVEFPSPEQLYRLARAAAMAKIAIEINVNQVASGDERMLSGEHLAILAETEVPIYIGTDIHAPEHLTYCQRIDTLVARVTQVVRFDQFVLLR